MGSAFLLPLLAAVACTRHTAPPPPPVAAAPDATTAAPADVRGLIGMRFRSLPEGLLAVAISPGLGAEEAGIVPGDLVVAVDGTSLEGLSSDEGRDRIVGAPDTTVTLTVRGPLGAPERTVSVTRRLPSSTTSGSGEAGGEGGSSRRPPPAEVKALTQAVRRGTPEEARTAAAAVLAADLGGMSMDDAVGAPLRAGVREGRTETTRAALEVLLAAERDDWRLANALGQVQQSLGDHAAAVQSLARAETLRPPDYAPLTGSGGDLGGNSRGRAQLAEAAWDAGQKKRAASVARDLTRTVPLTSLQEKLGLAPWSPGTPWSATLPPVPNFELDLLTGEHWSLEDHRGEVVLLTFWATWCGPCRKELPELEALWATRQQEGATFLAISLDDPKKTQDVRERVEELGVTFPVAHQPGLAEEFGVGPIPAVRVLNRSGALHYAAKGYSPASVERLNSAIQEALDAQGDSATVLGEAWAAKAAALDHFLPVAGATGVWGGGGIAILGVENAAPLALEGPLPAAAEANVDGAARQESRILAWRDGPVAADPGDLVVRAWGEDGFATWMTTLDAPLLDLASSGPDGVLWVATRGGLRALDAEGTLVQRHDSVVLTDLAAALDGSGAWGLGDGQRWWLPADGSAPQPRGPVDADYVRIDGSGGVAIGFVEDVVSGRFGPDGAPRAVAFREDNLVIGLGGDGRPAFTWKLAQDARLAAADLDGDGQDELLVSFERQGLAAVRLQLP